MSLILLWQQVLDVKYPNYILFTQLFQHEYAVTQVQGLRWVEVVWIQNFPFPKLVAQTKSTLIFSHQ